MRKPYNSFRMPRGTKYWGSLICMGIPELVYVIPWIPQNITSLSVVVVLARVPILRTD